jgi:hypothetical protein
MNTATLEALKESIAHWERMQKDPSNPKDTPSSDECPLCRLFLGNDCEGCPVSAAVQKTHCHGTPYLRALLAWDSAKQEKPPRIRGRNWNSLQGAWPRIAQEEIDFLTSLLPARNEPA